MEISVKSEVPAISVKGLHKRYSDVYAVQDVSFDVQQGSVVGFIGANGAGKTTTMRILATLEHPDEGQAALCGFNVSEEPTEVRRRLGWMPDSYGTYDNMSVWEYMDFFARAYGFKGAERKTRVDEVMDFIDLHPLRDRMMNKLSKGMGQRLCLGRTLIHDPQVLILDEPAAGLDPKARVEFKRLVRLLAEEGKTILISSHILSELSEMCDSLLFIDQGQIVHQGDRESLTRGAAIEAIIELRFLGEVGPVQEWVSLHPDLRWAESLKNGGRVVLANASDTRLAEVLRAMILGNVRVTGFHVEERKLEDVFVEVVEQKNRDRQEQQSKPKTGAE
ncbi:MAG: ATP-binding cassette domain-containing protein [Verrucomicrobiales bacterium]